MQISNSIMRQMPYLEALARPAQSDSRLSKSIGVPSEDTYTKEDAVIYQYNRHFDIKYTIDELASGKGKVIEVGLPNSKNNDSFLKAIETFRNKLEKKGLGDEINWKSIEYDFSSVGIYLNTVDQFSNKADYIASRYAVMQDRIHGNYSGKDLEEQMDRLNTLFSKATEKLADSYAHVVGGFLEDNGVGDETANLTESIRAGIENRVKEYSDYIQSNHSYAEIDSDSDKWLLQDDGYMAAQLREKMDHSLVAGKTSEKSEAAAYSLHDLEVAAIYVQQTSQQYESLDQIGTIRNEESIGLDLAVQSMKTDYLTKNSGISNRMASLINRTFDGYVENYLEKIDEQLKKYADRSMVSNSKQLYAPLDHSAVQAVYQYTKSQYQRYGDMRQALVSGAQYGENLYDNKVKSGTYRSVQRYNSDIDNWDNFFQSRKHKPYDLELSDLQKYTITINHFQQSVHDGNVQNIDLMLGVGGDLSTNRLNYSNINEYEQTYNLVTYA
ncbi:hypothetical protein [Clostridium sp. HBUAS56010]|uniref:hypothetical protein n=1 Tax=Clostridium sp. HBUAS56010 TaxID=2571127 RepID=UPI0011774041|nr:hypothetical protein [Clostridium sp. HBUAS56010]